MPVNIINIFPIVSVNIVDYINIYWEAREIWKIQTFCELMLSMYIIIQEVDS